MVLENILCMNTGNSDTKELPILTHSIKAIANNHDTVFGQCFRIADLGCSSSKNTLLVVHNIINIVHQMCEEKNLKAPQFQVSLNDLFGNDFNTLFKMLPDFYTVINNEKDESFGPCFVSAIPGSFYGRLFPDQSLHLVHSSYSIHWLSQIPEGIENNGSNIYITKTSPPNVLQAYRKQFHSDFTKFLQMRSEEIVPGGGMVLTCIGRSIVDPTSEDSCTLFELLAQSLVDMVKEGMVRESDISPIHLPIYHPCQEEVRNVIQNEGSFSLDNLVVFRLNWDPNDNDFINTNDVNNETSQRHGENASKILRAVTEPLLTCRLKKSIIDEVYKRYGKLLAKHLAQKKTRHFNLSISLTKK
uniref:benzoate carboxyl methyltransferase-like n=1 Tax=Erigeron canadensis TaxID=72917 RepID=UPI001CB921ED|nr:benzoate carboxyl methyltransferase-like [Erigeron canadensis]